MYGSMCIQCLRLVTDLRAVCAERSRSEQFAKTMGEESNTENEVHDRNQDVHIYIHTVSMACAIPKPDRPSAGSVLSRGKDAFLLGRKIVSKFRHPA